MRLKMRAAQRLSRRYVSKVIQECNCLQGLEGGLDTSHAPILHRLLKDDAGRGGIKPSNPYVRAGALRLVVDITDYGYQYTERSLGSAKIIVTRPAGEVAEQRFRVLKIRRVKAFGEPAINGREKLAGFCPAALVAAEP